MLFDSARLARLSGCTRGRELDRGVESVQIFEFRRIGRVCATSPCGVCVSCVLTFALVLVFMITLMKWRADVGSESLGRRRWVGGASCVDTRPEARDRRRGVEGAGSEVLVDERVRVDRQRNESRSAARAEIFGVVLGLSGASASR